jgi:hypothetical protein
VKSGASLREQRNGRFAPADLPRIEHHSIRINLRPRIAALTARNASSKLNTFTAGAQTFRAQNKTGG